MSEASATGLNQLRHRNGEDAHDSVEHPALALANGLLLALPLWVLIGLIIWALF